MTRIWQATDTVEWADDTMMEAFGNAANYNVIDGCEETPSGANLDVTVAAGNITHDGQTVAVAGGTVTLVADGSLSRWTWVAIDSGGSPVIVSGTPAADPKTPEVGDNVEIAKYLVTAGATVASSLTRIPKRLMAPRASDTSTGGLEADVTTTSTTLGDITGLSAAVDASTTYAFRAIVNYYAGTTPNYKFGITVPSGATLHAMCEYTNTSAAGTISNITASGGSIVADGFGTSTPGTIKITGVVITAGTAGDLQFQHALNTGTGTNTTLAKSRLELF